MKKSFLIFFLLFSGLLFANGKTTSVNSLQKDAVVKNTDDFSTTAGIVSNFLSVFEEGIIQPGTGIVHSTFNPVRTVNIGSCNSSVTTQNKINRQISFQFPITPYADVKPSTDLHVFLRVLLI